MTKTDSHKTKQQLINELDKLRQRIAEWEASGTERLSAEQAGKEMHEYIVCPEKRAVLGQLARGIGHELRNYLGSIKNATYFLNMALEETEPEVKEALEILGNNVARSEKIISSLLVFTHTKPPKNALSRNRNP